MSTGYPAIAPIYVLVARGQSKVRGQSHCAPEFRGTTAIVLLVVSNETGHQSRQNTGEEWGRTMQFTSTQLDAIGHRDGHLQLIACAGAGKTEVVARRITQLLTPSSDNALQPANIVAFTFTEKAAAELKERIYARVRESL